MFHGQLYLVMPRTGTIHFECSEPLRDSLHPFALLLQWHPLLCSGTVPGRAASFKSCKWLALVLPSWVGYSPLNDLRGSGGGLCIKHFMGAYAHRTCYGGHTCHTQRILLLHIYVWAYNHTHICAYIYKQSSTTTFSAEAQLKGAKYRSLTTKDLLLTFWSLGFIVCR